MSSFSYHELSHQDPSMKSKKNERGLNIILGVWTAVGVFFLYQGGLLENPTPRIGEFPGGEFVFKSDSRCVDPTLITFKFLWIHGVR
mmetsp:Transcript_34288/g.79255  ORF Transcript_34288/g.79255 Transcript_34288/m.79255 type:complete len:87 (+) Transcript_34288:52-312(+)